MTARRTDRVTVDESQRSLETFGPPEFGELFPTLFKSHAAIILIIDPDTGMILNANDAAEAFYGWPCEQMRKMRFHDLNTLPPEAVTREMERAELTERLYFEFRHRRADGSIRDVEVFSSSVTLGGKNFLYSIVHDTTERVQSEAALRQSEALAREQEVLARVGEERRILLDNIQTLVWYLTDESTVGAVNESFAAFIGVPKDECASKPVHELFWKDDPEDRLRANREPFVRRMPVRREEWVRHSSGEVRLLSVMRSPILRSDGTVERVVCSAEDITFQKQVAQALEHSETNFRTLFNTIDDLIVVATPDGRIVFANKACERKLGYDPPELLGMHVLNMHPADKRSEAEEIFAAMFRGERASCPLPLAAKDGELVPVETRVWFGKWNGSDCMFGVSKDLGAEEEAQQRFERLFRHNPSPMALTSLPGRRFVDANDAFHRTLGYSREELLGRTAAELGLFENPALHVALGEKLLDQGSLAQTEMQARRKDGALLDGLFSGEVIHSQGKRHFLTVMVDVTRRKLAEKSLDAERERLNAIIRGTNVGTWDWNVQTGETVFNERWAEIVGYTLEELAPVSINTWTQLANSEDLAQSDLALKKHLRGELDYYEVELRMKHKSGEWVWVLDRGRVATWDAEGKPLKMFGTHQDVTPRREVEEALRKRVAFEDLLVTMSAAFFRMDDAELDDLLNDMLRRLGEFAGIDRGYLFRIDPSLDSMSNTHEWCAAGIGPEKDNLQGLPVSMFPAWMEALGRDESIYVPEVALLPESWSNERELLQSQAIQSVLVLPVATGGKLRGFMGFDAVRHKQEWAEEERRLLRFLADNVGLATQRMEQGRALTAAMAAARALAAEKEEISRVKTEFLANMSHEIRTPMNAILGFAQVLGRDPDLTSKQGDHVRTILSSGAQLLGLLNDVLDMSKIEAGRATLVPAAFDLHKLMGDIETMFRPRTEAKGLQFVVERGDGVPRHVLADEGKLRQVIVNLMGNAVKFTESGGIALRLRALPAQHAAPEKAGAVRLGVEVDDSGMGISEVDRRRLFVPFQQAEGGAKAGGTGLGLAISRHFVEMMGGELTVTSRLGLGSCFGFTVLAEVVERMAEPKESELMVVGLAPGSAPVRLLVVDDMESNRLLLCELLKPVGFDICEASNGLEALEQYERWAPDAVLMDMRMPIMDGYEATRRLRKSDSDSGKKPVIIAITASAFEHQQAQVLAAGVDAYLRKPFRPEELFAALGSALGLRYVHMEEALAFGRGRGERKAPAGLSSLPRKLILAMRQAVEEGDTMRLIPLILAAEAIDPSAATGLRALANDYDYTKLEEWLNKEEGDNG